MTTREPLFTEQDRAELFALALYRDGLCPLCGRPREVCGAPEGTHRFEPVWEVCQATLTVSEQQNAVYTPDNHPNRASHLWGSRIRR